MYLYLYAVITFSGKVSDHVGILAPYIPTRGADALRIWLHTLKKVMFDTIIPFLNRERSGCVHIKIQSESTYTGNAYLYNVLVIYLLLLLTYI